MMSATRELARFVAETRGDDIPTTVLEHTKRCVLNTLGVALHATRSDAARIMLDVLEEEGGRAQATVLGMGAKTTVQNAALMNGFLAHLDDFDDTLLPTVFHPSAPTLPAALAIAEQRRASGRDFLTACALSLEVACRIAKLIEAVRHGAVWHMTGTVGPFGAAAAAARLLGLDADATARAFGLAGTQACGLRETFGTMTKAFHPGRAAQSGVLAARMAARGLTSTTSILEGEHGFVKAFAPGAALSVATDGLNDRWAMLDNAFKPYACGILAHAMVDAMRALRVRPGVRADRIVRVTGRVNPLAITLESRPQPDSGLESRLSFQHSMAVALIDGTAYPAQFTDERASAPDVARLRSAIAVTGDAGVPEDACELSVELDDGQRFTERVAHATGTRENPMRGPQLEEKFRALTTEVMSGDRAGEVIDAIRRLETLDDVGVLVALCKTQKYEERRI